MKREDVSQRTEVTEKATASVESTPYRCRKCGTTVSYCERFYHFKEAHQTRVFGFDLNAQFEYLDKGE